jgi:hypothetical protein
MLKTVVQTSHVSTVNLVVKTTLSSREIEGCFLLYFDRAEEARLLRQNSSSDHWPEINKSMVKYVTTWALFNFGILEIQSAASVNTVHKVVSSDTLLSRQEILRWVSKFVKTEARRFK